MISDEDFRQLITLIEDGEVDERMADLVEAVNDRNERRKGEMLRLVRSIYGEDAQIVTGRGVPAPIPSPTAQAPAPAPQQEIPEGHYRAADGSIHPIPPEEPPAAPEAPPASVPAHVEPDGPINLGVRPVNDSIGGALKDNDPDYISTGGQPVRYGG